MLLFKTQTVRNKHNINWHEEMVLGCVDYLGETWTNEILDALGGAMSINTAHKYVTQLINRGYLQQTRGKTDKRYANVALTEKAVDYLFEIEEAAWTKDR